MMSTRRKRKLRREHYLNMINEKYHDPGNIFPKPITNEDFIRIVHEYLLGEDFYVVNPVSHGQALVEILLAIIQWY